MSDPRYLSKEEVAALLPMVECIAVMKEAFKNLADGKCLQPLRSLMWLPDRKGLLGMMPGYAAGPGVLGIKVITVFHGNRELGLPSHQGTVTLFDAANGKPLLIADAMEITSIQDGRSECPGHQLTFQGGFQKSRHNWHRGTGRKTY